MADCLTQLDVYAAALDHEKQMQGTVGEQKGEDDTYAVGITCVAETCFLLGDLPVAETLYQSVALYVEREKGVQHNAYADAMLLLGSFYALVGQHFLAVECCSSAAGVRASTVGAQSKEAGEAAYDAGLLSRLAGDMKGAKKPLQHALTCMKRAASSEPNGSDGARANMLAFTHVLYALGVVHLMDGDYENAGKLLNKCLEIRKSHRDVGPNHVLTSDCYQALSVLLRR